MESVSIGMESTVVNALIYIAENRGYFKANGINALLKDDYPSGAAAAAEMLEGKMDLATSSESVVVRQAFAQKPVQVLVSIDNFLHMKLIGRKDRGIEWVRELAGKRIGVPLKTAGDFMLGRFLELNGLRSEQAEILDVQAPKTVDALVDGSVDAVVAWQPNVLALQDRLGVEAVVFDVQSKQPIYCVVSTTSSWAREHPDLLKRFLASLGQAEDYLFRNPEESRKIVQKRLGYDDRYIQTIWPEHLFSLRLDQSMVSAMEDQARWMIRSGLIQEKAVPDFMRFLNEGGLKAVRPSAVNIIR